MYINKKFYLFLKFISIAGLLLWSIFLLMMMQIFFLDIFVGGFMRSTDGWSAFDIKMYIMWTSVFLLLFGAHFWLYRRLANANIYNSLFVNDPDGVIQLPVLSRAMGKDATVLKKDVSGLIKMRILKNCKIEKGGYFDEIKLFKDTGSRRKGAGEIKAVCPSCGGETMVRIGFVKSCPYCGSKLDV